MSLYADDIILLSPKRLTVYTHDFTSIFTSKILFLSVLSLGCLGLVLSDIFVE